MGLLYHSYVTSYQLPITVGFLPRLLANISYHIFINIAFKKCVFLSIWGFLKIGNPKVTMGFNTKTNDHPVIHDLDDLGATPGLRKPSTKGWSPHLGDLQLTCALELVNCLVSGVHLSKDFSIFPRVFQHIYIYTYIIYICSWKHAVFNPYCLGQPCLDRL